MIRVFIATGPRWAEHEPVLEYSIRSNTDAPVEITWMRVGENDLVGHGCTGFTNFRYAIPRLAGGIGFGIYLDIDMLLLADIAELWAYRKPGAWVCLKDGTTEVSVIDCSLRFPSAVENYKKWDLQRLAPLSPDIPLDWNTEDTTTPTMKLIHFTDLSRQPWFTPDRDDAAVRVLHQYQERAA
jgi:hypothetical protein